MLLILLRILIKMLKMILMLNVIDYWWLIRSKLWKWSPWSKEKNDHREKSTFVEQGERVYLCQSHLRKHLKGKRKLKGFKGSITTGLYLFAKTQRDKKDSSPLVCIYSFAKNTWDAIPPLPRSFCHGLEQIDRNWTRFPRISENFLDCLPQSLPHLAPVRSRAKTCVAGKTARKDGAHWPLISCCTLCVRWT